MAGFVDYDSDVDCYDDDDYLYADAGDDNLADELAAGAIPEATPLYYREDELAEDYDNYAFWSEIEYGNAEFYDQEDQPKQSDKTKKSRAADIKDTIKKIRLRGIKDFPTVLWRSSNEALNPNQTTPFYQESQKPTALMPHWREFIRNQPAPIATLPNPEAQEAEDDACEDESEQDDEELGDGSGGEDEDTGMDLQDVDPDMLKAALAAKLSSSGMAGKDQSALMEAMMQMLAGGPAADTDNLLESLTSNLLNQVTEEGGSSSMGQWLSGQGVSLEEGDEADEQDAESPQANHVSTYSSPKDSVAAEPPAAPKPNEPIIEELLASQPTAKKRKHPLSGQVDQDTESNDEPTSTRKRAKQDTLKTKPATNKSKSILPQGRAKKADETTSAKPKSTSSTKTKADAARPPRTKAQPPPSEESSKPTTRKRKAADEEMSEEKPKRQLRNFAAPTASSQSKTAESKTADLKSTRSGKARQ